jgi:hypothetical protein
MDLYAARVGPDALISRLEEFARGYGDPALSVHQAAVSIDERQDGEPVTRIVLLLAEPSGDTWDIERVRELRHALGRKATELGLPSVSITLVPESEAELLDDSAR